MLAGFFLLMVSWNRVLTDCHGGPETISHYFLQATHFQPWSSMCCCNDQGQDYPCTVFLEGPPLRIGPDVPDPGNGSTVSTNFDPVLDPTLLPTPPVGGLVAWPWHTSLTAPIIAVDCAGNQSDAVCP